MNIITLSVRDGQIECENIPQGWGLHVKNYDTQIDPLIKLSAEEMAITQVAEDETGYFYSAVFTDTFLDTEVFDETQLELPIEGL